MTGLRAALRLLLQPHKLCRNIPEQFDVSLEMENLSWMEGTRAS